MSDGSLILNVKLDTSRFKNDIALMTELAETAAVNISKSFEGIGTSFQPISTAVQDVAGTLNSSQDMIKTITDGFGNAVYKISNDLKELKNNNDSATVSQLALNLAMKAAPYDLIATAVGLAAFGIYKFMDAESRAYEKLKEMRGEYEKSNSKLKEMNSELLNVNARIDELNAKDTLTIVNQEELKALKEVNDQLEYQVELQKAIAEYDGTELEEKAVKQYKKSYINTSSVGLIDNIDNYYKEVNNVKNLLVDKQLGGINTTEINGLLKESGNSIQVYTDNLQEYYNQLIEFDGMINGYTEEGAKVKSDIAEKKALIESIPGLDFVNQTESISTSDYISPASISGRKKEEQIRNEAKKYARDQARNTKLMADEWEQAEQERANGSIKSDTELYAKKLEIWKKYGDASSKDHWSYQRDLYSMQQRFSDDEKAETEKHLAEQERTQREAAEAEAKAVKDKWDNIERLNSLGMIDDEEAYRQKLEFIQEYCPQYKDEWYDYYKDVYDIKKKAEDEQLKSLQGNLSDILDEHQKAFDELEKMQKSYRDKLMSVGGSIFQTETVEDAEGNKNTVYSIANINEQMNKMKQYHSYIQKLKNSGASTELLKELTSLSDTESFAFAKKMSSMSSSEFSELNKYYEQRAALADELSADLYADEAATLQDAFSSSLTDLATIAYNAGITSADKFTEGFNETLTAQSKALIDGTMSELSKTTWEFTNANVNFGAHSTQDVTMHKTDDKASVNIKQYNYSPKALSAKEIFQNTNKLSQKFLNN